MVVAAAAAAAAVVVVVMMMMMMMMRARTGLAHQFHPRLETEFYLAVGKMTGI